MPEYFDANAERKFKQVDLRIGRLDEDIRRLFERIASATGASTGTPATASSAGTIVAGAGLTGGGTIPGTVTIDVGAGDGLDVNANDIDVDVTDIIDTAAGITEAANNIQVNLGTGLTFNAGAVILDWSGSPVTIEPDDATVDGVSLYAARIDHQHAIVAAAPGANSVDIGASAEGAATSFARSDHTHNLDESIAPTWAGIHTFQADIQLDADLDFVGAQSITTTAGNLTIAPAGYTDITGALDVSGHGAFGTGATPAAGVILNVDGIATPAAGLALGGFFTPSVGVTTGTLFGVLARADTEVASFTLTSAIALYAANPIKGAGSTITTAFGLYVQAMTSGSANYAIYTNAGAASLGDDLEFRQAASITTTADNLTIAPAGDLIFNPTGNDILPTTNYDLNLGSISKKYLTLHAAELWVETLVAQDTLATIGGRILIGPTTKLTSDLPAIDVTMFVEHNNLANGDRCVLEADGSLEWIAVASAPGGVGPYSYTITRNLDGSGANAWYAGDAVFNTGTTGNGFIDLYSLAGVTPGATAGPTIVGNVRKSATYNDYVEAWAIGNLNGLYGYGADTYGVGLGEYSEADYITIDPTNGVRFFDSGDVLRAQLSSGNWTLGYATNEHVNITNTVVQIKDGATVYTDLTAGVLTLGDTAKENVLINASGVQLRDVGTVYGVFAATTTIGATATDHVSVTASGLEMRDGAVVRGQWQTDGDIFIGSDIAAAGTTYFAVFATNQAYNGENVFAGDMLIGDNSANKANIFWDVSAGKMQFRGGQTMACEIGTDGAILAGGGDVVIDGTGITLETGSGNTNIIKWYHTSETYQAGEIYTASALSGPNYYGSLFLRARNSLGAIGASMVLEAVNARVRFYQDIHIDVDTRVGGGLYVGGTGTDPGTGEIHATVQCSGWLPMCVYQAIPYNVAADGQDIFMATIPRSCTLRSFHMQIFVATTNNGANYWTVTLYKRDGTNLASGNTSASGAGAWIEIAVTGLSTALAVADDLVYVDVTKTGSPGNYYAAGPAVFVT